jgi:hypothetical protein
MRRAAVAVVVVVAVALAGIVAACSGGSSSGERGRLAYQYSGPYPEPWCREAPGVFVFEWLPTTYPALAGSCRTSPYDDPSTLAELSVPPGSAIEIPVELPAELRDRGCVLDSIALAHGSRAADLAIEVIVDGVITPVVEYEALPEPSRDTTLDASTAIRATPVPPPPDAAPLPDAAPEPDAAPSVEIMAPYLEPDAAPPDAMPDAALPPDAEPPPWPQGAMLTFDPAERAPDDTVGIIVAPGEPIDRAFVPVRHAIGIPAPYAFVIRLRARTQPFGIAVRSDRTTQDPRLLVVAPGGDAIPTHLIPQAAIAVSRCKRSAREIANDLD